MFINFGHNKINSTSDQYVIVCAIAAHVIATFRTFDKCNISITASTILVPTNHDLDILSQ